MPGATALGNGPEAMLSPGDMSLELGGMHGTTVFAFGGPRRSVQFSLAPHALPFLCKLCCDAPTPPLLPLPRCLTFPPLGDACLSLRGGADAHQQQQDLLAFGMLADADHLGVSETSSFLHPLLDGQMDDS